MSNTSELMEYFLDLSSTLTGFSRFHLQGTGQAEVYYNCVEKVIGPNLMQELLKTFNEIDSKSQFADDPSILEQGMRCEILGSEKLGPIARNILKLWYVAVWYQLPKDWRNAYGTKEEDGTFVPDAQSYPEGLLWPTIGVTPPGAKPPGYASWAEPPSVSLH